MSFCESAGGANSGGGGLVATADADFYAKDGTDNDNNNGGDTGVGTPGASMPTPGTPPSGVGDDVSTTTSHPDLATHTGNKVTGNWLTATTAYTAGSLAVSEGDWVMLPSADQDALVGAAFET